MVQTRSFTGVLLVVALTLAVPRLAEAGPPLICHPFDPGSQAVLPWGSGPAWNNPDNRYDVQQLTSDTLRLLTREAPVLARMENLRRATIYAAQDPRVANELLSAVLARALSSVSAGAPDAQALFNAGYLIESYKQAAHMHRYSMLAPPTAARWTLRSEPGGNGYSLVIRAMSLAGGSADMEFAASLMSEGTASANHRRRAAAAAAQGSLLARNLQNASRY